MVCLFLPAQSRGAKWHNLHKHDVCALYAIQSGFVQICVRQEDLRLPGLNSAGEANADFTHKSDYLLLV